MTPPPKDVNILIPRTCEYALTWQRGIKIADSVNIVNQLTKIGGFSWVIHKALRSRRGRQKGMSEWFDARRIQLTFTDFEDEGGHEPKNVDSF